MKSPVVLNSTRHGEAVHGSCKEERSEDYEVSCKKRERQCKERGG